MRIAYVVGRYPAVSHTFIVREVRALRRLGVEVSTISINRARPEDQLSAVDREEAAQTFGVLPPRWGSLLAAHAHALLTRPRRYLAALRLGMRLARPGARGRLWSLFYFLEAGVVWRRCHGLDVDHIHVHHLNQASDATMMAIEIEGPGPGGRPRWTWSYTMHGPDEFADVSLFHLADKARSAAGVACISDFARSQVMAVLPEDQWSKLRVIHCGVVPDELVPPQRDGRPGGRLDVLYVGRMVPVKGQTIAVDAIEQLVGEGVDVHAVFIGQGPQREVLEREVARRGLADRVTLPGAVGHDEIHRYFADADVFLLPSFAEGVPVVLMEAMAMEVPVVTSRIAGIPELVEDRESGFVLPPGRADRVADALRTLAADPELRRRMGRSGREKVLREYDVDDAAVKLRDMFAAVTGREEGSA